MLLVNDPVSPSSVMYLGCHRFFRAKCIVPSLYPYKYMPSHSPPETKLGSHRHRDSHIHASARQRSEVCRVSLERRSLKKINWPTPCFFLLKPGMFPSRPEPSVLERTTTKSEDTQKDTVIQLNITHLHMTHL